MSWEQLGKMKIVAGYVVPSVVMHDVDVPLGITRWLLAVHMCGPSHLAITIFILDANVPLNTE